MIDYDKVQDSIIDSLVSDSSKWLEDEKKEVYSNERVAGNTISKDLVTNVFDYIMKKSCGYAISDMPNLKKLIAENCNIDDWSPVSDIDEVIK